MEETEDAVAPLAHVGEALTRVIEKSGEAYNKLWELWERVERSEPGAEEAYERWICGLK
jgi:hypothetical protein